MATTVDSTKTRLSWEDFLDFLAAGEEWQRWNSSLERSSLCRLRDEDTVRSSSI
jgi:hypothetical protein